MAARRDADMTQGSIWRHTIYFAVPMAMGLLFQQLYNTVDSIVVGQFVGKEALAAVGSTGSIINTLVGFAAGLSTGSSVVISQCYGAHDHPNLSRAVHTTVSVTFILAMLFTLLGSALARPLLRIMSTPADVMGQAETYLSIYFLGIGGLMVYNMGAGVLRAVGDSRRPLYFLIFSALLNIALDLLFVVCFGMGIEGVAYATVLSQFVSAALVLVVLSRDHGPYGLRWHRLRIHCDMVGRIFSIGLPAGFQQALTAFSNVFVQSYVNHFGSACMAGWSCYNKLDAFLFVPPQAIGMAATTFVGQNYGARQHERARKGVRDAFILSFSLSVALTAVVMIFADTFIRFFSTEADVVAYGVRFIRLISPFYLTLSCTQIFSAALRGTGDGKTPMYIMLFSFVAFRQAYLFAAKMLGNQLTWIALGYPMGWMMCSVLLYIFYRRCTLFKPKEAAA